MISIGDILLGLDNFSLESFPVNLKMSSTDPQGDLKKAIEWARQNAVSTPIPNSSTTTNWIPIIIIVVLLALAGWWWWANYSHKSDNQQDRSTTFGDLKQGAKNNGKSSRLLVKPNGTLVSE